MAVGWLDPAIDTGNTGDNIIAEAIEPELRNLANGRMTHRLTTRRPWTASERRVAQQCSTFIVGGTNILTSHPTRYRQWVFGVRDVPLLRRRCVLFGVGWWQYQDPPDTLARLLMRTLLDPEVPQGVRDSYTVEQLAHAGISAVNIGCPTLWRAQRIGRSRGVFRGKIVATVTDYMRDAERDTTLLTTLRERANPMVVWPQGSQDAGYVASLGFADNLIARGLDSFDKTLREPGTAYVGTRLHGGMRALWFGVPAVIVEIDNRAAEMAKNFAFWSLPRTEVNRLDELLDGFDRWELDLPDAEFERWRSRVAVLIEERDS